MSRYAGRPSKRGAFFSSGSLCCRGGGSGVSFQAKPWDEDSLTGALGQALAMRDPMIFVHGGTRYSVQISYEKVRDRGRDAPEKSYGSDGIFQISVTDSSGRMIRRKVLPFQSKKNWKGKDAELLRQVIKMQEQTPGGIVVDYRDTGCKACSAESVIESAGNRRTADRFNLVKPLGQILSRDFLDCSIGLQGLFYHGDNERYNWVKEHGLGPHVITTSIEFA